MHYPAMPAAASASNEPDAFEPSPALTPLHEACRSAELPENALDDDCDGSIDAFARDVPMLIALSFPRAAAPVIAVRSESAETATEQPLVPTDCQEQRPFCTVYLESKSLTRGRHTLLARHAEADTKSAPHALVVSVQSRSKVTTYLATLDPNVTELSLGKLALP